MNYLLKSALVLSCMLLMATAISGQEKDISGVELSIDQDRYADFLRDSSVVAYNYAIGMRIGLYGEYANHTYLGLPWVRQKIDGFILDKIIENSGYRLENRSHSFVFTVNGFSPSHISDTTEVYLADVAAGYSLAADRPFSSFTGFRSTRRLEGYKLFAHSAYRLDLAINTSFTFGMGGLGLAHSIEDLFGRNRPDGILWSRDENKPYPSGQVIPKALPIFMYSISAEAVVLRPLRKIALQLRPELNLGYYTDIRLGLDFGKVMNVERNVDNMGYTDTNNPALVSVNTENIGLSVVAGMTAKLVLYNAHLNGLYGRSSGDHYYSLADTKRLVLDGYVGIKLQLFKKIEFDFSINSRTAEFSDTSNRRTRWGTLTFKYLLAPEGEGCYN